MTALLVVGIQIAMSGHMEGTRMTDEDPTVIDIVDEVLARMLSDGAAEKLQFHDNRVDREYSVLATPDALDKPLVAVAVPGFPERAGVWSYTLLRELRVAESSMEPYFNEFAGTEIGLIALDPNSFGPDRDGGTYSYQLDRVINRLDDNQRFVLLGFSMGGRIVVEFLQEHPELLDQAAALVLIDPMLPNRLRLEKIRTFLENRSLLIASDDEPSSPGKIASVLLDIDAVSFPGIHGEMPNKALGTIMEFLANTVPDGS